jgi:hypothetical protein
MAAQRLDRSMLGWPVVGVHAHAAVPTDQEPAPQVPGGEGPVGLALEVGEQRSQSMVGVCGEDGRPCGRVQVFPVDAKAG